MIGSRSLYRPNRKILIALLLCMLAIPLISSPSFCAEVDDLSDEARMKELLSNGEIREGMILARRNSRHLKTPFWNEQYAIFSTHANKLSNRVLRAASFAVSGSSDKNHAMATLAIAFAQKGQVKPAMKVARKVLADDEKNSRALIALARAYSWKGKMKKAERYLMEAVTNSDGNEDVMIQACRLYTHEGRPSDVMSTLELWTKMKPNSPYAHYRKGQFFYDSFELRRARVEFEKAISLNPGYWDARKALAYALTYQKEYKKGAELFEALLKERRGYGVTYIHYAECLEALGRNQEALHQYTHALKNICGELDSSEAIKSILKVKIHRQKWAVMAACGRARMLMKTGKLDEALIETSQLSTLLPDYLESHYMKMLVLAKMKKYELALFEVNRLIEEEKDIPLFYLKRAEIHKGLNQPKKAAHDMELVRRLEVNGSVDVPLE